MALGESAEGSALLIYQPALAQRCSLETPGLPEAQQGWQNAV